MANFSVVCQLLAKNFASNEWSFSVAPQLLTNELSAIQSDLRLLAHPTFLVKVETFILIVYHIIYFCQ